MQKITLYYTISNKSTKLIANQNLHRLITAARYNMPAGGPCWGRGADYITSPIGTRETSIFPYKDLAPIQYCNYSRRLLD